MQYKDDAESMINDIDNAGPGKIEIGARQMDSGLLMSLYDEVRSQLERGNFTFLKHSHRQTHEKKKLKEEGNISSGYVAFPAKLMVNKPGDVDVNGKKNYRVHTNFSLHEVVKKDDSL